jgi:HK97 family phage major capsid protein
MYGRTYRDREQVEQRMFEITAASDGSVPGSLVEEYNHLTELRNRMLADAGRIRSAASGPNSTEVAEFGQPDRKDFGRENPAMFFTDRASHGREVGLRAIERMSFLSAAAGDRLTDLVERDRSGADARYLEAVSRPEYASAFMRRLTNPDGAQYEMSPEEAQAMRDVRLADSERALSVGSNLLPLPATIDPSVHLTSDGALNPIRELASVQSIATSEWHGVNSAGVTAGFSAELQEVGDNTPTPVPTVIKAEKAQAYVEYSIEAGMDWASLQQEMAKLFADAKDVLEAQKFTTGTGTNEPEGLISGLAATSVVTGAGTATFAIADLYSVQNALPARFSPRARWLSSLTTANTSWQFVAAGSTTAARVWNDSRTSLLGKPWSEVSTMATTTATGDKILLYGDLAATYKIVDRIGLAVEPVNLVMGANRRPLGSRGLYAYWRVGAAVLVDNGARLLRVR